VLPRNNPPSFQLANVTVLEDQSSPSIPDCVYGVLTNGDAGPTEPQDEDEQQVSFFAFVESGSFLFERLPTASENTSTLDSLGEANLLRIHANGTLLLKRAANRSGTARVAVVARDDGGIQGGMGRVMGSSTL
jgi:hypothetical protein